MKKIVKLLVASIVLLNMFTPVYAVSTQQTNTIQHLLDEECRRSGVPGLSVAIVQNEQTHYYSSGYANKATKLKANENTLYELASVSKAFTATGVLMLEQTNLLALTDSVQTYIPWLTLSYKGEPIDMSKMTIGNLLYHTSGLTNATHTKFIPQGKTDDMLAKTVKNLVDVELDFLPGEKYDYGTVNYDILGLIIEIVSKKRYEDFMKDDIFTPLGLNQTYAFEEDAQKNKTLAQGYRSSFLMTKQYDAPDFRGNKPAGYLISSAKDMAKWLQLQLGLSADIPDKLANAIKKSHQPDTSVQPVDSMYYAGGWSVNKGSPIIEHSGNNPSFTTQVALFPEEQLGITLLSNANTTNIELVYTIKKVLAGDLTQTYHMGPIRTIDLVFTIITLIGAGGSLLFLYLISRSMKKQNHQEKTLRRMILRIILSLTTLLSLIICLFLPTALGMSWSDLNSWQPSIFTACLAIFCLSLTATLLAFSSVFRFIKSKRRVSL